MLGLIKKYNQKNKDNKKIKFRFKKIATTSKKTFRNKIFKLKKNKLKNNKMFFKRETIINY